MLYNVVLVSAVHHESATSIHTSLSLESPFYFPIPSLSVRPSLSFLPPPIPLCLQVCSLCFYFCPANRFIGTIFLGSMYLHSVQFNSVAQSCLTRCDPMNRSTSGLPVHHQLPEFTQTHVHRVRDAIQPSHPLSSPAPPAPNPSQHQSLFQ